MAVTPAMSNQFKQDMLNAFSGDTFKIALYLQANSNLSKSTTAYTTTGEVSGAGYSAGGLTLSGFMVALSGDVAYIDWTVDPSWSNCTITADAAMIYNASKSNKCVAVYTFQSTSTNNGTLLLQLPAPGANALVRVT